MTHEFNIDEELTTKYRQSAIKAAQEIEQAFTDLDLGKELSLEHIEKLIDDLGFGLRSRAQYLRTIRLEHERVAKALAVQAGRTVHRDTKSLREATRVDPDEPKTEVDTVNETES